MGYEVVLLPCPAEVDGAAAIEWFEQYEEPDGDEGLSPQALDAWRRVVADAQALRPGVNHPIKHEVYHTARCSL